MAVITENRRMHSNDKSVHCGSGNTTSCCSVNANKNGGGTDACHSRQGLQGRLVVGFRVHVYRSQIDCKIMLVSIRAPTLHNRLITQCTPSLHFMFLFSTLHVPVSVLYP